MTSRDQISFRWQKPLRALLVVIEVLDECTATSTNSPLQALLVMFLENPIYSRTLWHLPPPHHCKRSQ